MKNNHVTSTPRGVVTCLYIVAALFIVTAGSPRTARGQLAGSDRGRGREMLRTVRLQIQKHYYDPTYHGVDLDARFKAADEAIKQAKSNSEIFGIIGQAVVDLNDSHTLFIPPKRAAQTDYGWRMQIIGSRCFIVAIKPGSDAETKGLKVGDQVISVNGYEPVRENLWKMQYTYYGLKPQAAMALVVQSRGGQPHELLIMSKVTTGKRIVEFKDIFDQIREDETESFLRRQRFYEDVEDIFIWKMPQFDLSDHEVDDIMERANKRKSLILDLRGNGGGAEATLQRLLGNVFDHDIKVGDLKRRNEMKPLVAKSRGTKAFKGQLIVLVDSESGSAAEIFARVMQLEKRGLVFGDQTAGAVMRSKLYPQQHGTDQVIYYAVSITDADVIMTDGQSLERVGVTPDEKLLMSDFALATSQDPVLSRAVAKVGGQLNPKKAGTLFPIEWKR
ncbi:MAG: S41 family peptidase [Pyrinomonadaceae bacterium]